MMISRVRYYVQTKVEIGKIFEKEIDGIFSITKFDLSLFNYNEIEILYNNCVNFQDFHYLVMEAKYSSSKLDEIVEQLKKDHSIISNLKNEKVLYLGIMNDYMPAYNFINHNLILIVL